MPAKEIKELRQAGKLEEALALAKKELHEAITKVEINTVDENKPESLSKKDNVLIELSSLLNYQQNNDNLIWAKRNLGWVFYEYLKLSSDSDNIIEFSYWLNLIKSLEMPETEKMLIDNVAWKIGSFVFKYNKSNQPEYAKVLELRDTAISFNYAKPSEAYTFLYKAFHKALKDTDGYLLFADWWGFENFMPKDFQKERFPNGKEMISIAEQAYVNYTKQLLPKQTPNGEIIFNRERAELFLPILTKIVEEYPQFQYPAYFNAKLLLALGDKENMLFSLLPFAKKRRNDFWVWEILSEAFSNDLDKVFACYCKALSCSGQEEMLVNLRQKMARVLISREQYNEAKTEIDLLVRSRTENKFNLPDEVVNWQSQEWYKKAEIQNSNINFYKQYTATADAILFSDIPEETILVEFINKDKKLLYFIASETKYGFLKYDRFFSEVKIGDILKVRFQGGTKEGAHQLYTAIKSKDDDFKRNYMKEVSGKISIATGKTFGFLEDNFIHSSIVARLKLTDGMEFTGTALKSYNQEKKKWVWKLI
jgi:hypothetical protein